MKQREFVEGIRALGFVVERFDFRSEEYPNRTGYNILTKDRVGLLVAYDEQSSVYMSSDFLATDIPHELSLKVFDIFKEYAQTPVQERKDFFYYLYWTDISGRKKDVLIKDSSTITGYHSIHTFADNSRFLTCKHISKEKSNALFTHAEIMKLPKRWRPEDFGGLGLVEYELAKEGPDYESR